MEDLTDKAASLDAALSDFVARVAEDRTVLAVVRLGSGRPETLWDTDEVHLWVVLADGTRPRRRSDGEDPRVFRTWVERDVNLHAELVERSAFQRMVEGGARQTLGFSWWADRRLVHCADEAIGRWFESANRPAARDRGHDQLALGCWVADAVRRVRRRLDVERDLRSALGDAMELAHALAYLAIVDEGAVVEHRRMERALALQPELLRAVWLEVLERRDEPTIRAATDTAAAWLDARWEALVQPVLAFIDRVGAPVPLAELAEHFATTALHPFHLVSACEWSVRRGLLVKLSSPAGVSRKSRVEVDEPAYARA